MKIKQINKIKISIFEEKELKERLGLDDNQIKLILNYQEKFPELLKDEEGFCIDARQLWNELGKPQGDFSNWIKRKFIAKNYKENIDFSSFHKTVERKKGATTSIEYILTLNCAKKVSMRENTDEGDLVCDYFILMEQTLRNYENWNTSRGIEKDGWNKMTKCIEEWCKRKELDSTIRKFYTREANLLNESLLELSAIEINWMLKNNDKLTRNHLNTKINNALNFLQELNCSLLFTDMSFEQRKKIIKTTCTNKYSNLKTEFQEFASRINKKAI